METRSFGHSLRRHLVQLMGATFMLHHQTIYVLLASTGKAIHHRIASSVVHSTSCLPMYSQDGRDQPQMPVYIRMQSTLTWLFLRDDTCWVMQGSHIQTSFLFHIEKFVTILLNGDGLVLVFYNHPLTAACTDSRC